MDDDLITQIGLLLTQVRFARMALEDIERSTAKYAGLSLSIGASGSQPFGAPPIQDGALKVFVVNLGDLAVPTGGDLISGILGGAGRFLGGFLGQLVGGTISGVAFTPITLAHMASITRDASTLYGLYLDAQKAKPPEADTGAAGWLQVVLALPPVLDGLTVALPMVTGTVASLLARLPSLQIVVSDLVVFAAGTTLRLRAFAFALISDTLQLSARLAAGTLEIVSKTAGSIIQAIFAALKSTLEATFAVIDQVGPGLARTMNQLIAFLGRDVVAALDAIGGSSVVRLVWHFSVSLPLILPALAKIKGTPLSIAETDALTEAQMIARTATFMAPRPKLAGFPDLATTVTKAQRDASFRALEQLGLGLSDQSTKAFGAATSGISAVTTLVTTELAASDTRLKGDLADQLKAAARDTANISNQLHAAATASSGLPQVDAMAAAYEKWLAGRGFDSLMSAVRLRLGDEARLTPERSALATVVDREPASSAAIPIEIDRIRIELVAPATSSARRDSPASRIGSATSAAARGGAYLESVPTTPSPGGS